MVRGILGAVLAAVVMFMWGFVYWSAMNMASKSFLPLPDTDDIVAVLRQKKLETGMYLYPTPVSPFSDQQEASRKLHAEGPLLQLAYRAEGMKTMPLLQGFTHSLVIALFMAWLLAKTLGSSPGYIRRVIFVTLLGVFASVWANGGDVIWWFHSPDYFHVQLIYMVVSALLMGLVLAAFVKPKVEAV